MTPRTREVLIVFAPTIIAFTLLAPIVGTRLYMRNRVTIQSVLPQRETLQRPVQCNVGRVRVTASSMRTIDGKKETTYVPPVVIWASYESAAGDPLRDDACVKTWQPPEWTITGDEHGVLFISEWPWVAALYGPPGHAYTVRALDPGTGIAGMSQVVLEPIRGQR